MGRMPRALFAAAIAAVLVVVAAPAASAQTPDLTLRMHVWNATAQRGGNIVVTAAGCVDLGESPEVRLVADIGNRPVLLDAAGFVSHRLDTLVLTVPGWAPKGPARVEASCHGWVGPIGGDGGPWLRGDYDPVPVTIAGGRSTYGTQPLTVTKANHEPAISVSGRGCRGGRVRVHVQPGRARDARAVDMRLGGAFAVPDAAGRWSAKAYLSYWWEGGGPGDPAPPGVYTVFARCVTNPAGWDTPGFDTGFTYRPVAARITRKSVPLSMHLGYVPGTAILGQCRAGFVAVLGQATTADGSKQPVFKYAQVEVGYPYATPMLYLNLPADTEHLELSGWCLGDGDVNFAYKPYSGPKPTSGSPPEDQYPGSWVPQGDSAAAAPTAASRWRQWGH